MATHAVAHDAAYRLDAHRANVSTATLYKQKRAVQQKEINTERHVYLRNKHTPPILRSLLFRLLLTINML